MKIVLETLSGERGIIEASGTSETICVPEMTFNPILCFPTTRIRKSRPRPSFRKRTFRRTEEIVKSESGESMPVYVEELEALEE